MVPLPRAQIQKEKGYEGIKETAKLIPIAHQASFFDHCFQLAHSLVENIMKH